MGTVWLPLDHVFLGLDSAPLVAEAWREIARGPQGSIAVSGITQRRPIVENAQLLFQKWTANVPAKRPSPTLMQTRLSARYAVVPAGHSPAFTAFLQATLRIAANACDSCRQRQTM